MKNNDSTKWQQLSLNINYSEFVLLDGLLTKQVLKLVRIFTNEPVTAKQIHQQLAQVGKIQFVCDRGTLSLVPSFKGKSGKFWRWDIIFSPIQ